MDAVFKALADPTRREILRLLKQGEMTAGQIAERFEISAPSMSHHFNVLKQADLVFTRRAGQQIYYSLNTTVFQDVVVALFDLFHQDRLDQERSDQERSDQGRSDQGRSDQERIQQENQRPGQRQAGPLRAGLEERNQG